MLFVVKFKRPEKLEKIIYLFLRSYCSMEFFGNILMTNYRVSHFLGNVEWNFGSKIGFKRVNREFKKLVNSSTYPSDLSSIYLSSSDIILISKWRFLPLKIIEIWILNSNFLLELFSIINLNMLKASNISFAQSSIVFEQNNLQFALRFLFKNYLDWIFMEMRLIWRRKKKLVSWILRLHVKKRLNRDSFRLLIIKKIITYGSSRLGSTNYEDNRSALFWK